MEDTTDSQNSQHIYRIDKFKVPSAARAEFIQKVLMTHRLLKTLPGFLGDSIYEQFEQMGGPGVFNFVTLVAWENVEVFKAARQSVLAKQQEVGFNPTEVFARLGIEADLANYTQIEA